VFCLPTSYPSHSNGKADTILILFAVMGGRLNRTVRKMDLILRPIERRPQMQFSMARRFKLQLLRRYSVKFYKMRNITLGSP
jgi:hypothetical protein